MSLYETSLPAAVSANSLLLLTANTSVTSAAKPNSQLLTYVGLNVLSGLQDESCTNPQAEPTRGPFNPNNKHVKFNVSAERRGRLWKVLVLRVN